MASKRAKKRRLRKSLSAIDPALAVPQDAGVAKKVSASSWDFSAAVTPLGPIALAGWACAVAAVALFYLVLKMFAIHAYAGDEHIYLYQAKLVSEGVVPYADFAMAHPPLQTLFTALVFKLFGYHFILGRLLPVLWCLAGGILLAVMVLRELGAVASVASTALYLLSYEPLRASSHYTGVNMTVALLVAGALTYRAGAIPLGAALCAAATFTRLYAIPGVIVLALFALLLNAKQGLRLIRWYIGVGGGLFFATGLWTGFNRLIDQTLLYHAQKSSMGEATLAVMRDTVLFHNAPIVLLFIFSQITLLMTVDQAFQNSSQKKSLARRLRDIVGARGLGLLLLCSMMAVFVLAVLLSMNRVWMYYFIPAFPFAAVPAGWLVARWFHAAVRLVQARANLPAAGISRADFAGGSLLLAFFVVGVALSPILESNLGYYERAMQKDTADRTSHYGWKPGLLPDSINQLVRTILWRDVRTIGERYMSFTYLLWHENRAFDLLDEMVATIENESSRDSEIFGDSGTVPLLALQTDRRIAAHQVDTNLQRYRSDSAARETLVREIDDPKTELIVLRDRFGVAGVQELQRLVSEKYRFLKAFRSSEEGATYRMYKRLTRP